MLNRATAALAPPVVASFTNALMIAAIGVFFFGFFFFSANQLSSFALGGNDVVYNADTADHFEILAAATNYQNELRDPSLLVKHPLYRPVATSIFSVLEGTLPSLDSVQLVQTYLALLGAISLMLVFWILYTYISNAGLAALFTVAYGFSLSSIVFFSIPETYILSNLALLIFFCFLMHCKDSITPYASVVLAILIAVAGLFNPTLLSLLLVNIYLLYDKYGLKNSVRYIAMNTMIVFTIFYTPYLFILDSPVQYTKSYFDIWASMNNFTDLEVYLRVFFLFFVSSIFSPLDQIPSVYQIEHIVKEGFTVLRAFLYASHAFFMGCSLYFIVKDDNKIVRSMILWLLCYFLFYVFFNPYEAELFSLHMVLPTILVLLYVYTKLRFRYLRIWAMGFVALVALNNLAALHEIGTIGLWLPA